jgi:N-terminal acetyltransferase 2
MSRRAYAVDTAKTSESLKSPLVSPAVDEEKLPVTQRLRILFKKYRWPALTVYIGLSIIDFGISFLAVRALGTEKIGRYEKIILRKVEDSTGWKAKGTPPQHMDSKEGASIWTEVALAYTIHKTLFALVRVPLTVAVTPYLVKLYHRKGYGAILAQIPAVGRMFQASPAVVVRK